MTRPYDPEFTCLRCGEGGHPDGACPAPVERAVAGWVCRHGADPTTIIRDECAGDEPVYEGDTVHTDIRFETTGTPGVDVVRSVKHVTVTVTRGCRSTAEGRSCDLNAGHPVVFNHGAPTDHNRLHWKVKR